MTGIITLVVAAIVFWLLAFISGRRFGVLGLALAAGALLSQAWSGQLIDLLERAGVSLASVSLAGVASLSLVLLPAAVLLFSGPSYQRKQARMIGATLFALFATVLAVESLSSALVLDMASRTVFDYIMQYQVYAVTAGVAIAVLEMLAIHTTGGHARKRKH